MLALIQPIGILAVNAIPLVGVIWFGWSIFEVVILYWLENVAIGIAHFVKLMICTRTNSVEDGRSTSLFFAMHYGLFTFVHGVFVIVFFGVMANGLMTYKGGLLGPAALIMLWQFLSLGLDYIVSAAFKGQEPGELMFQPYPRVFALHITVIAAGWLISEAGSPVWLLVLLVGVKTAFDLGILVFVAKPSTGNALASLMKRKDGTPH